MVDSLKKFREIAAFVVLGVVAVNLLMGLISLIYYSSSAVGYGFTRGAEASANYFVSPFFALLLAALVGSCVLWERTKNARLLTLLSLIVVGGGLLLGFLLGVIGLASGGGGIMVIQFFTFLTSVAVVALAVFALYRMLIGQPAPAPAQNQQFGYPQGQLPGGYDPSQGYPQQPGQQQNFPQQPQQPQQPTWQPDQASGASWQTAGQAASGASASSWGNPGQNTGWDPGPEAPASASGGPNDWQPQHVPQQPYAPTQPAQPGESADVQHQPSAQEPPAPNQPGQPNQQGQEQQNRDWWSGPQQ